MFPLIVRIRGSQLRRLPLLSKSRPHLLLCNSQNTLLARSIRTELRARSDLDRSLFRNGRQIPRLQTRYFAEQKPTGGYGEHKPGSNQDHSGIGHATMVRLQDLDKALRVRGYSILRIGGSVFAVMTLMVWWFRDPIRSNVAEEIANVASQSLEDRNVVGKAEEFSKQVVQQVLTDPNIRVYATQFLLGLFSQKETHVAVGNLVNGVLADEATFNTVTNFLKQSFTAMMKDPAVNQHVIEWLGWIFAQPYVQDTVTRLLKNALLDPTFLATATQFFTDILTSQSFTDSANNLGVTIAQHVLARDDVTEQAKGFVREILQDQVVHKHGGDAIWEAVKYSFIPTWFMGKPTTSNAKSNTPGNPMPELPAELQTGSTKHAKPSAAAVPASSSSSSVAESASSQPAEHTVEPTVTFGSDAETQTVEVEPVVNSVPNQTTESADTTERNDRADEKTDSNIIPEIIPPPPIPPAVIVKAVVVKEEGELEVDDAIDLLDDVHEIEEIIFLDGEEDKSIIVEPHEAVYPVVVVAPS
eukprot:Colp12_sorted_trinity150504_noHs@11162